MFEVTGTQEPSCVCPRLTVHLVIFSLRNHSLQVLLTKRTQPPHEGVWAIPGGEVLPDEALRVAACRKLEEETGINDVFLEQLYTFGDPGRDPRRRVITVAYYAVLPTAGAHEQSAQEAERVCWWPVQSLPSLAFDHAMIVEYAVKRLRYKLEYTAVGFELLPDEFTLTELQTAYEIVLRDALDKRNFRRKILGANIIEWTGAQRIGDGRPAKLYRYREDAVAEVQARRLFP
jgi:8-oxo-dGTP diphosphatase